MKKEMGQVGLLKRVGGHEVKLPPVQRVRSCKFCTDYKGQPKPIPPRDLQYAIRMPDGSYKCHKCQEEELQSRIVRVTPNSERAQEIRTQEQQQVDRWNQHAMKLNRSAGTELLKLKRNKYVRSLK